MPYISFVKNHFIILNAGITALLLYNPNPMADKRNEHNEYGSPAEALCIITGKSAYWRCLSA